ncbi:MAG: hypothetical protein AAF577_03890 [Pseudomonadota bacterium]
MRLTETGPGPIPTPPLSLFKEHLRLGFGFADDGSEDVLLGEYLRAAVGVVERRTARALVTRPFVLSVSGPDRDGCVVMPVGPVSAVTGVSIVDGVLTTALDVGDWRVSPGETGQRVGRVSAPPPVVPAGGTLQIAFLAGLAADWDAVPADLAQAVLILAADFYARRGSEGVKSIEADLPEAFLRLIGPWRPIRV